MEDLLRSLRNLGLKAPESSQLLELLDDDDQVQERLAQILSLSSLEQDFAGGAAALMGQDLLQEAVKALLDNFKKSLQRQQQAARREGPGGGTAKRVKWPPRKALLARQAAALQRSERERSDSAGYRPRLVFDGSQSFHSTSKLADLKQVACADLTEAPKRFNGCYLLCRVVTPLLLYCGVTFIVDDPSGAALPVSVSHFTSNLNLTTDEVSQLLPVGTFLAIREPFVSVDHQSRAGPCLGKAEQGIRVDSPSDVVILDDDCTQWAEEVERGAGTPTSWMRGSKVAKDSSRPPREEFSEKLDALLHHGRPGEAWRVMKRAQAGGCEVATEKQASVFFHLDEWEAAKEQFDKVDCLQTEGGTSDKGLQEGDYEAASDFAIGIAQLTPRQAGLRCRLRLSQATRPLSGAEMRSIYFAATNGVTRLDTSDYIGAVVVLTIPGAGRGLVTTREVEAGELLLCCRAVCAAFPDDEECRGSPLLRLNVENAVVSTTSQVRAQTKLIHAIVDRPELALPILGLTAGPDKPDSEYVGQEYPLTTRATLDPSLIDRDRLDVDASYVDGVLRFNAFGPAQAPLRDEKAASTAATTSSELQRSTMPHPLPAILNHACLPNVSSVFFSNIVTTRALSRLPIGTEIVHQYVKGEEPIAIRAANLSKHGFQCACLLCEMDRADGQQACTTRARIVQGESKAVLDRSSLLLKGSHADSVLEGKEAHDDIIEALEALIDRIQSTYSPQRASLRPDLFYAIDARTRHIARTSVQGALSSAQEALSCVGAEVDLAGKERVLLELPKLHFDPCLALILFIASMLSRQHGKDGQSKAWTNSAFWAHECMIGGGLDVFLDRWGSDDFSPALQLWQPSL